MVSTRLMKLLKGLLMVAALSAISASVFAVDQSQVDNARLASNAA